MGQAHRVGRVGVLAVGLGIGAGVGASGVASAEPVSPPDPFAGASADIASQAGTVVVDALRGGGGSSGLNLAISFDGINVIEAGSANATSGTDDFAIAIGAGSSANATGGIFDSAFADGVDSTATAGGIAGDNYDYASASGAQSTAIAGDNGTGILSSNDTAIIFDGPNAFAQAYAGNSDTAVIFDGANAFATAYQGNMDFAAVFDGADSTANAGQGNMDFAALLGDMLGANATFGSNLFDITP